MLESRLSKWLTPEPMEKVGMVAPLNLKRDFPEALLV